MTQEEKAKAYDEALEKAKDFYKGYKQRDNQLYADDLETIFPELCESEDERIRKEIEQLIQCMHDADPRKKRWIAWLEKQKEYESTDFEYVWDRTDCGALTSALDKYSKEAIINMCHAWYDKGIELERKSWLEKQGYTKKDVDDAYLKGIYDAKHELEKQGEQKPYGQREECLDCQFNYSGECKGSCAMKRSEQKPQRMVSAEVKEALYDKPTDEEMKELLRTEYEKGRADTIAEMEKEWSEEDEKRLKSCLNILQPKTLLGNVETINTKWLKSLKDKYIWRPSSNCTN